MSTESTEQVHEQVHDMGLNVATIYHNTDSCIENFFAQLPIHHKFSDSYSLLANGQVLHGISEHDVYCPLIMRNQYKDRTVVFHTKINYQGGYGGFPRLQYECPKDCTVAFVAAHDWTLPNDFMIPKNIPGSLPIYENMYLDVEKYVQNIFQSFVIAFYALQNSLKEKLYIRIAPIAMGPSIGKHLFQLSKTWYMKAVCLAILHAVNSSWVETIDLIDFFNIFTEIPKIPNVSIFCSRNEILDYPKTDKHYALIAPVDSFSKPWLREPLVLFDNLAACIINNTSIYKETWTYQFKKIKL